MSLEVRGNYSLDTSLPNNAEFQIIEPVVLMRPHHFLYRTTQDALIGEREPDIIAEYQAATLAASSILGPVYRADLVGDKSPEVLKSLETGLERYYRELRDLDDDSTIRFDLGRDGVCLSMCQGRHCTATNYDLGSFLHTTKGDGEAYTANSIVFALSVAGARIGVDYARLRIASHTYQNYGGKPLNTDETPSEETAEFWPLVARTGMLRKAIRMQRDPTYRVLNDLPTLPAPEY